jgi:hypothetical protein
MLNRSGDSGHPCLAPDFRGNDFIFSLLSIIQLLLNIKSLVKFSINVITSLKICLF